MRDRRSSRLGRWILSAGALSALLLVDTRAQAQTANVNMGVYNTLKRLETMFPFPKDSAFVTVGTFNARTGQFVGLKSIPGSVAGKPGEPIVTEPAPATASIDAVKAFLTFKVVQGSATLSIGGREYPVTDQVTVPVGTATTLSWQMASAMASYHDKLTLLRPAVIGMGVFTVPAVPIAIVYDPPQDSLKRNLMVYTTTQTWSTTLDAYTARQTSSEMQVTNEYAPLMELKKSMSTLGSQLVATGNPYAVAGGTAAIAFANGLGSADTKQIDNTSQVIGRQMVMTSSISNATAPGSHLGPGQGDLFLTLKNARFVWLGRNVGGSNRVTLALLGWEKPSTLSAHILRSDLQGYDGPQGATFVAQTGLPRQAIADLLALDPFVRSGPKVALASPRYAYITSQEVNGTCPPPPGYEVKYTVSTSDYNVNSTSTTTVTDFSRGYLSFAGIGVTSDSHTSVTQTCGMSRAVTEGLTVSNSLIACATADEIYTYEVYRDVVFGTIATRLQGSSPPRLQGIAQSGTRVLANEQVTLLIGGKRYVTRTDAQGRYAFGAAGAAAGDGMLSYGGQTVPVKLQSTAMKVPMKVVPTTLKPGTAIKR
jgi:hypothetical protein